MNDTTQPADRFAELPEETRRFFASLDDDDIQTLRDGVKLVNAVRTVGSFFKWLLVGILGMVVGTVMLWESVQKIIGWLRG